MKNLQKGGGNLSSSLRSHLNMTSCWHAGYLKTILIFKKDNNKILPILNGICFDENLYIRHQELLQMKKGDNPLLEIKKQNQVHSIVQRIIIPSYPHQTIQQI